MLLLFFINLLVPATTLQKDACMYLYDYPIKSFSPNCYKDPDVMALTMIQRHGYKVLSYNVTTPDGYILTMFRIPPDEDDFRKNKQPVLLEHGLFHDSSSWTFVGNRSLAFRLASRGYDVWLGNERGTRYSRTHVNLNASDFKYWTYSLDTLAGNEIPTFLETIANVTNQSGNIIYIGHSRGTTLAFMYASEYPEHAQKFLKGIIALCPIVYFDSVLYMKMVLELVPTLGKFLLEAKISAIFYDYDYVFRVMYVLCSNYPYICILTIDVSSGITWQFLPQDLLVVYTHSPSTESIMLIMQYAQMANSGKFQKFDYGPSGNVLRYNQTNPPLYNLGQIKTPIFMYYGKNDIFISRKSMEKLFREIGSCTKKFWKVPYDQEEFRFQFSHNDFVWAKYLEKFLYKDMYEVLDEIN